MSGSVARLAALVALASGVGVSLTLAFRAWRSPGMTWLLDATLLC